MHLQLGLWPSLCTHRREKQGRAGRHAHSWKQQLRTGRGSAVTVQGTVLIQSSFCSTAHQKGPIERCPRRLNQMAWQQAAVLLSGGSWARVTYKTQTAIEAAHLQTLSRPKDYVHQLELETWALSGLPKQEMANKIHIWAAQSRCFEVPMNEHVTDSQHLCLFICRNVP